MNDDITNKLFAGDAGSCPRCGHPGLVIKGIVPRIPRHVNLDGRTCSFSGLPLERLTSTGRLRKRRHSRYTRKG